MKVGDLVKKIAPQMARYRSGVGIVTQEDRERGIVFVHFRDKAHWVVVGLVERISESR